MATTIPQVPNFTGEIAQRTDPTTFAERADPQYAYQAQLSVDLNTTVDAINIVSSEVEASAADAEQAAETASSSANFIGRWDEATGAATKGSVYYHSGQNWQLLDDIADITASEPSNSNSEWLGLASGKNQVSTSDDSIQLTQTAAELQQAINDVESGNVGVSVSDGDVELTQTGSQLQDNINSSVGVSGAGGDLTQTLAELQSAVDAAESVSTPVVSNLLVANSRWNVPYGDQLVTSTATAYANSDWLGLGRRVVGAMSDAKVVDGVFSSSDGSYRVYAGEEDLTGYYSAGVLLEDGTISTDGVSLVYSLSDPIMPFYAAVDMTVAPAHLFPVMVPVADATTVTCAVPTLTESARNTHVIVDFGLVTVNTSYLIDNPYGNDQSLNVTTRLQFSLDGVSDWFTTGQSSVSGTSGAYYGAISEAIDTGVAVQTAANGLFHQTPAIASLTTKDTGAAAVTTSAYCRVVVYFQGGN